MAEIRPYDEVFAEQVAQAQAAVDKAVATSDGQNAQAGVNVLGGLVSESVGNARPVDQGPAQSATPNPEAPAVPVEFLVQAGPADPPSDN